VSPAVICFLYYAVIKVEEIKLSLQGKLMVSVQKIESERGARTVMRSRVPPEPQKLYVPGDVESILDTTPTEREIDLMNTRQVDRGECCAHFDRIRAVRTPVTELNTETEFEQRCPLKECACPALRMYQ
jgi:hypothetical protein